MRIARYTLAALSHINYISTATESAF